MKVATTKIQLTDLLKNHKVNQEIAFVPTMGALHFGHLELIKKAKSENDLVVSSIFVNPTQFSNPEDLLKYPRNTELDIQKLIEAKCDFLFLPNIEEIYSLEELEAKENVFPQKKEVLNIFYDEFLFNTLEGEFRPGHYQGVCQVVKKLFEIVLPDQAYFGKKDYQQQLIIQKMVDFYNFPISIIPCQTIRQKEGLALSSRNQRLNLEQKKLAQNIFISLKNLQQKILKFVEEAKYFDSDFIEALIQEEINFLNNLPEFKVEYLKIRSQENLRPIKDLENLKKGIILIAVYVGQIRLIDNLEIIEN